MVEGKCRYIRGNITLEDSLTCNVSSDIGQYTRSIIVILLDCLGEDRWVGKTTMRYNVDRVGRSYKDIVLVKSAKNIKHMNCY